MKTRLAPTRLRYALPSVCNDDIERYRIAIAYATGDARAEALEGADP